MSRWRIVAAACAVMVVAAVPGRVSAHDDAGADGEPGWDAAPRVQRYDCLEVPANFRSSYQVDVRLDRDLSRDAVRVNVSAPDGVISGLEVPAPNWHAHREQPGTGAYAERVKLGVLEHGLPVRIGVEPRTVPPAGSEPAPSIAVIVEVVARDGTSQFLGRPGDLVQVQAHRMPDGYASSLRQELTVCVEPVVGLAAAKRSATLAAVAIVSSAALLAGSVLWSRRRRSR